MGKTSQLTIALENHNLEAVWHGPPPDQAPTLVFLHEGLGCVDMWRNFPAALADSTGWGALIYSRLGYGRSNPCNLPRPVDFMHHEASRDLPAVLDATGVRDFALIGHSDGGSIALLYAGLNPSAGLRGLITEAAHVFVEPISVDSIEQAKVAFEDGNLREGLQRYHGDNTDCAFRGWNDVWLNPEFLKWNIETSVDLINAPMLAIQGEDDQYGTSAQIESIVHRCGAEKLMISNCGHSPHREQPEITLQAMACFIQNHFT